MATRTPQNKSIHFGPALRRLTEAKKPEVFSGMVETVCDRYAQMISDALPDLEEAQWCAICDALNGVWMREGHSYGFLWAEIADADRLNGLGDKWGIDAEDLAAHLRSLPLASTLAVVEVVERFWSRAEMPTDEALAAALESVRNPN